MLLTLPTKIRRAWLRSFWLVLTVPGGILIAAILAFVVSAQWGVVAVLFAVIAAISGLVRPQIVAVPYQAWNSISKRYARVARTVTKAVCFYVVLTAVGLAGSTHGRCRPRPGESLWKPSPHLLDEVYLHPHDARTTTSPCESWVRTYLSWARDSGNVWAVCLVPYLALLAKLEDEQQSSLSTQTYTLF